MLLIQTFHHMSSCSAQSCQTGAAVFQVRWKESYPSRHIRHAETHIYSHISGFSVYLLALMLGCFIDFRVSFTNVKMQINKRLQAADLLYFLCNLINICQYSGLSGIRRRANCSVFCACFSPRLDRKRAIIAPFAFIWVGQFTDGLHGCCGCRISVNPKPTRWFIRSLWTVSC